MLLRLLAAVTLRRDCCQSSIRRGDGPSCSSSPANQQLLYLPDRKIVGAINCDDAEANGGRNGP
jgi:hypothetical protein